jgi:hypothetical protein
MQNRLRGTVLEKINTAEQTTAMSLVQVDAHYVLVNTVIHSHTIFLFTSIPVKKNSILNVGLLAICITQHTKYQVI